VPPNSEKILTPVYSNRLMRNFANHVDFCSDLAAATKPLMIISGADDRGQICRSGARDHAAQWRRTHSGRAVDALDLIEWPNSMTSSTSRCG
jgi:hypothetical protein